MKSSSTPKSISRATARNATLLNLLATPGLGSLTAHRWVEGIGQLTLSVIGFVLVIIWFIREMIPYYSQMFGDNPAPHVGLRMLGVGSGCFALAWVWSLFTSLSLSRAISTQEAEALLTTATGTMPPQETQLAGVMAAIPQWQRRGQIISRTFQFNDFVAAMKFVNAVALAAEQARHHPDIDIRWNRVTLALTTHDAGGLTEKDFSLAKRCDVLAAA